MSVVFVTPNKRVIIVRLECEATGCFLSSNRVDDSVAQENTRDDADSNLNHAHGKDHTIRAIRIFHRG